MNPGPFSIALAVRDDIGHLAHVEAAAAGVFKDTAFEAEIGSDTLAESILVGCMNANLLWVVRCLERKAPVAFAVLLDHGSAAHLQEISVDAAFARQGVGTQLMNHVLFSLRERGYQAVTLSTYKELPWNAPFYKRFGFESLRPDELSPALRMIREKEQKEGLSISHRVLMRVILG